MPAGASSEAAAAWLDGVLALERRGELLLAYDTACRALQEHPDDLPLRHRAVLLLARAGSTEQARRRFFELRLDEEVDDDAAALGARLEKDATLALPAEQLPLAARHAAERYLAIGRRTNEPYPLINAATLLLLAGDEQTAASISRELLTRPDGGDYWSAATAAEAWLVVGDADRAAPALQAASARAGGDWAAIATTRRQLELVCAARKIPTSVLSALARPRIAHFCGHRMASDGNAGICAEDVDAVADAMAAELGAHPVHAAYGSLASGADLLWAEALLARGAELHVVLPFDRDSFVEASVAPGGPTWVERFHAVLPLAASVSYVTEQTADHDDALFVAAAGQAMGSALLRARFLAADAVQLAVWDGQPRRGAAGTAGDVARWRATGRVSVVIDLPGVSRDRDEPRTVMPASARRAIRCLVFADVAGYTRMNDNQLVEFQDLIGNAWAAALATFGNQVLAVNTWGDALFVVLSDVAAAARCAIALRDAFTDLDLTRQGFPALGLRVAGHVGPVFEGFDPVARRPSWTGVHVNRAARLEPVTPAGEVYVTEAFAAALELAGESLLRCEYVGHLPTAKGYDPMRMHRLHQAATPRTSPAQPE